MSDFGKNLSFNLLSFIQNIGKQAKSTLNKNNPAEQVTENIGKTQTKPNQSLSNTNSNIVLNQPTLTSPTVTQSALNTKDANQPLLTSNLKDTSNAQAQSTPNQVQFNGPRDLPAYAGIANMSLKSWVAGSENKDLSKAENNEKFLNTTLEGIKGFQKQNYEGFEGDKNSHQKNKNKNLLILSHIFSSIEQSGTQETDLLVKVLNFKKLGSSLSNENNLLSEGTNEDRLSPPLPNEIQRLNNLDPLQIKHLHQLMALPSEFPECLRLFAKDRIEINPKDLNSFLTHRLKLAQEQVFGVDGFLNTSIANFAPLLNQNNFPAMLPLILLYYPLPLPLIKQEFDFVKEWEKKKKEKVKESDVIASCEIYYLSKTRGRFLLKFELNKNHEFSFDVQTVSENNGIVKDLEIAVAESMYLLEHPPLLSDLNILLTEEIYKATDIDEELSIVSTGPLRLEIVLAVYSALVVLNKLNNEIDPAGIIEMS